MYAKLKSWFVAASGVSRTIQEAYKSAVLMDETLYVRIVVLPLEVSADGGP